MAALTRPTFASYVINEKVTIDTTGKIHQEHRTSIRRVRLFDQDMATGSSDA